MKLSTVLRPTAMFFVALIAVASSAQAQDDPVLTINLSGASSAEVVKATPEGRQSLGTATAGSGFALNMSALNAGKGERVKVKVDRSGDRPVIVLEQPGVVDADCANQAEGDCEDVETVVWGTSRTISVNAGPPSVYRGPGSSSSRFTIGFEWSIYDFSKLDAVACNDVAIPGLLDCTADGGANGPAVSIEYSLTPNFDLGFQLRRTSYSVNQTTDQGPLIHDVSVFAFDFYSLFRPIRRGPVLPFITFGASLLSNSSDVLLNGMQEAGRSENGLRWNAEAGIDLPFSQRWAARARVGLTGLNDEDADMHKRFSFGIRTAF